MGSRCSDPIRGDVTERGGQRDEVMGNRPFKTRFIEPGADVSRAIVVPGTTMPDNPMQRCRVVRRRRLTGGQYESETTTLRFKRLLGGGMDPP